MIISSLPVDEAQRLHAVKSYTILDTIPESDYDNITTLAASICEVPIALITVMDEKRNFFKSTKGIDFNESPRDISFCAHTIREDDILIVEDSREDSRFANNPLVKGQNAIFYAGVPIVNPEGFALGTLCVFDHKPKVLNDVQINALKILGQQTMKLFELRKKNIVLEETKRELEQRNNHLKLFAGHVSHDLKSPLANISSLTSLLMQDNKDILSNESIEYLDYIEESATILRNYIDGILGYYKADEVLGFDKEDVDFDDLAEDIKQILISKRDNFEFHKGITIKNINKAALSQILINLVDNALKHNDKAVRTVKIDYKYDLFHHQFSITDNGIGIPLDKQDQIFEMFKTLENNTGKSSTGIGLSTVKNLVEKLGGTISVASAVNQGSTFTFTMPK
ncbi:sensor histidine kinase [Psychroserpens sp.]|uniref:sensor histidine kinase n=1 Tax=Psychroserpens sp. TaxID=2020870 RepID=UPI003C781460